MRAERAKFPQKRVFDTRFRCAAGDSVADGRGGDSPWRRPRRLTRSVSTSTPEQVPDAASLPSIGLLSFDLRPDRVSEGGTTWPTFQVQDTCSWIMALLSAPDRAAHGALQVCVAGGSRTLHHLINAVELIRFAAYSKFTATSFYVVVGTAIVCFLLAVVAYDPQRGLIRRRRA